MNAPRIVDHETDAFGNILCTVDIGDGHSFRMRIDRGRPTVGGEPMELLCVRVKAGTAGRPYVLVYLPLEGEVQIIDTPGMAQRILDDLAETNADLYEGIMKTLADQGLTDIPAEGDE